MAFTRSIVKNTTENMNNKRESGEFWLKIGFPAIIPEDENQPEQEIIVSLPFDIDLERMPEQNITTSEGWVNQLNKGRNKLRMDILEEASKLDPGEVKELNLKVYIFRKTGKTKTKLDNESPFVFKGPLVK